MLTNLPFRTVWGFAILLTALLAGCRDDPAPSPDARATQVPAKPDKPTTDKPVANVVASATSPVASAVKPTADVASAGPSASAAASLAMLASAAPEAPPPPPDPSVDCDKLLSMDEIATACKKSVSRPSDQPTENIGTESRCTRRFENKDAGLLTIIITRHANDAEAQERFRTDFKVELSKPDVIPGAGDFARYYLKKGVSGDPILTAEALKGRFNITLFNPEITVGGQKVGPVCDEKALDKLIVQVLERIP